MWKGTLRGEGQSTVKEEIFGKPQAVKPNISCYDQRQNTVSLRAVPSSSGLLVPQAPEITESVLSE